MTVIRVKQEDLDFTDDHFALLNDKPFTGIVFDLNANGELWSEMSYVNGWQEGFTREWSKSRTLIAEEQWKQGYRHGSYSEWFENGKLKYEAEYEFYYLISSKEWSQDGNLIKTFQLSEKDSQYGVLLTLRKKFNADED